MDRIESFFIQAVAVSSVALALCAGLSIAKPADADLPIVKLERVVVTPNTTVVETGSHTAG